MSQSQFTNDVYVSGTLACSKFTPPASCISDAHIIGAAGVQASKLQHQYEPTYSQVSTANAANDQRLIWIVKGATATIVELAVGAITAFGAASSSVFDLLKNGVSILSATVTLDNGTASFALKNPAGFTSTSLVAGDVLEIKVSGTAGANPAKGLFARLTLREDAQ